MPLSKQGQREESASTRGSTVNFGLGDAVALAAEAVGIKPCERCEQTQAALNEWSRKYMEHVPERLRERLGLERVTTADS